VEGIELRFGPWEDALHGTEADVLICDPPYSEKTHSGHDVAVRQERLGDYQRVDRRDGSVYSSGVNRRKVIAFEPWTERDVWAFVLSWTQRVRGWFVAMTDDVLVPTWKLALNQCGRYVFAPLPFVAPGSRVRLAGDGPSAWTVWIIVARPRCKPWSKWGTLNGAYVLPPGMGEARGDGSFPGTKPLWLMQSLVRDYSRPGDLVVDPCAGTGTTLLAAAIENRRALGAERDEETYQAARERLSKPYTPSMF